MIDTPDFSLPAAAPSRRLSCGVVILNDQAELLLCHVTGQDHWDLPKGGAADDETPLQAALRETREETGLLLQAEALLDLGRIAYRARKDLHLFATRMPRIDPALLWCESRFDDRGSGTRLPEMDGYGWFPFGDIPLLCTRKLSAVLLERLNLPALLASLPLAAHLPAVLPMPAWPVPAPQPGASRPPLLQPAFAD